MSQRSIRAPRCPIDVFDYRDYRAFLADYYQRRKPRGFSYRAFSRAAQLGAPNYLKLVIMGKRNLTPRMAARFAAACGLNGDAATYFEQLVAYNQASSAEEQLECAAVLRVCRDHREARMLEQAQAMCFNPWYVLAIRELCAGPGLVWDAERIARTVQPPIEPADARKAVEILLDLGLVKLTQDGRLEQGDAVLSTSAETRGTQLATYHSEMMRRAENAMKLLPAEQRDISSLTFCLSANGIARLKARIQAFRRELIELAEKERDREQVIQLNLQLFPLSVPDPAWPSLTTKLGPSLHA